MSICAPTLLLISTGPQSATHCQPCSMMPVSCWWATSPGKVTTPPPFLVHRSRPILLDCILGVFFRGRKKACILLGFGHFCNDAVLLKPSFRGGFILRLAQYNIWAIHSSVPTCTLQKPFKNIFASGFSGRCFPFYTIPVFTSSFHLLVYFGNWNDSNLYPTHVSYTSFSTLWLI